MTTIKLGTRGRTAGAFQAHAVSELTTPRGVACDISVIRLG